MENINLFEDISALEPKCPRCGTKIELDITTKYHSRLKAHICMNCKNVLE